MGSPHSVAQPGALTSRRGHPFIQVGKPAPPGVEGCPHVPILAWLGVPSAPPAPHPARPCDVAPRVPMAPSGAAPTRQNLLSPSARCSPCPPTPLGTGWVAPGAAVVGVTPSLSPSAPAPAGFASAPAGVSRDLNAFLSRNAGFLVKSCSSVAVTTLLQLPSRDVFLCCDRDVGRRPPAIGVRGGDGEELPLPRARTRHHPRGDPVGLQLRRGAGGGISTAPAQPWLGLSHPGDSGGARSHK